MAHVTVSLPIRRRCFSIRTQQLPNLNVFQQSRITTHSHFMPTAGRWDHVRRGAPGAQAVGPPPSVTLPASTVWGGECDKPHTGWIARPPPSSTDVTFAHILLAEQVMWLCLASEGAALHVLKTTYGNTHICFYMDSYICIYLYINKCYTCI